MVFFADALRKLIYLDHDFTDLEKGAVHYNTSYDGPLLNSVSFEHPHSVRPPSGTQCSSYVLAATVLGSITMRARHKEKWWLGLMLIGVVQYTSMKAHKVNNGLVGHQTGFFAAAMLGLGSLARLVVRSGTPRWNLGMLATSAALAWYEVGRFHMWTEHVAWFRMHHNPHEAFDLLQEYVPQDIETAFVLMPSNATTSGVNTAL